MLKGKRTIAFFSILGEIPLFILLVKWSYILFVSQGNLPLQSIFLDNANLVIHEQGHVLFGYLGQAWSIAGGTIVQLLVPLIVFLTFLWRSRYFICGLALYWLGENLVSISVYIKDARFLKLSFSSASNTVNDWNYLLSQFFLLNENEMIAKWVFTGGIVLMISAIVLMLIFMFKTFKTFFVDY